MQVGYLLVTAWITIVDGGKKKRKPFWAKWLERIGEYLANEVWMTSEERSDELFEHPQGGPWTL